MLRSLVQSTDSRALEAEGEDVASADIALEALIPDGWKLRGSQYKKVPDGFRVTAVVVPVAMREISASGADYASAKAALFEHLRADERALGITVTG